MSAIEQASGQPTQVKMTSRHHIAWRVLQASLLLGVIVAGFIGLSAVLAGKDDEVQTADKKPLPVETMPLRESDSFQIQRTFTGTVKAVRTSDLSFRRTAKLISVLVNEGTRVKENQILATLDERSLRAREQELIAQKNGATALLKELIEGPRKQTIASARAVVSQRQAELELEQAELDRAKKLYEDAIISRSKFDTVQFGTRAAQARLESATQKLVELEAGTRPEKIEAQQAVVEQLVALLSEMTVDLEDSKLKAPFAGVISKREADEGTIVSPGVTLLRLVDDSHLEAWVGMPAVNAIKFSVDQEHQMSVNGQAIKGTVSAVLPELDPVTRTRTVIFNLKSSASKQVVPFQIVRIEVEQQNKTKGFWVPVTSLVQSKRGLWALYVAEPGKQDSVFNVARREIEVLHLQDVRAFVRGTIQPGERIIIDGTHRIVPGQRVSVASEQNQPRRHTD